MTDSAAGEAPTTSDLPACRRGSSLDHADAIPVLRSSHHHLHRLLRRALRSSADHHIQSVTVFVISGSSKEIEEEERERAEEEGGARRSMAGKENNLLHSRVAAARKRPALPPAAAPLRQFKRKCVPLDELPTLSNASPILVPPSPKPCTRSRARKEPSCNTPPRPAITTVTTAASDVDDDGPQLVAHHASDIYTYLHSMEIEPKRRPLANYIEKVQTDVTANMRGILVDWLIEVAEEYKLVSDTLYLTVSYIDRFLSFKALNCQKLQLLSVYAMLIASKYEEINPPHVEDFCYTTDNSYTKQEVVQMVRDLLNFLNFEMSNPTINFFLKEIHKMWHGRQQYPRSTVPC